MVRQCKYILQTKKDGKWKSLRGFGYSYNKKEPWRDWKLTRQRILSNPLVSQTNAKKLLQRKNFRVKKVC